MSQSIRLTAEQIATALGGARSGRSFMAKCPGHNDRTPSLSIADGADGKILVHCHAGCSQEAVIAALEARALWPRKDVGQRVRRGPSPIHGIQTSIDDRAASKREFAMRIWSEAIPIAGTAAEIYLRTRGITIEVPPSLRFHERLKHGPTGTHWPAMLGLVTDCITGERLAIHRTYLAIDGSGKAPIEPAKMMLGPTKGGVIRLGEAVDHVTVGEGIETCLSAQQACGVPAWAALSSGGLKALNMPPGISLLTILADGDEAGETAAVTAAQRLRIAVRTVRIVRGPKGRDLNDVLTRTRKDDTND